MNKIANRCENCNLLMNKDFFRIWIDAPGWSTVTDRTGWRRVPRLRRSNLANRLSSVSDWPEIRREQWLDVAVGDRLFYSGGDRSCEFRVDRTICDRAPSSTLIYSSKGLLRRRSPLWFRNRWYNNRCGTDGDQCKRRTFGRMLQRSPARSSSRLHVLRLSD